MQLRAPGGTGVPTWLCVPAVLAFCGVPGGTTTFRTTSTARAGLTGHLTGRTAVIPAGRAKDNRASPHEVNPRVGVGYRHGIGRALDRNDLAGTVIVVDDKGGPVRRLASWSVHRLPASHMASENHLGGTSRNVCPSSPTVSMSSYVAGFCFS